MAVTRTMTKRQPESGHAPPPPRQPPRFSGRNPYSVFVSSMKVLLPALAAGLAILVMAWPQFSAKDTGFRIETIRDAARLAKDLNMINARFSGIDETNRPYTLTADMASQSPDAEDLVNLQLPKADITLQDGTWLAINSQVGRYNRKTKMLDLDGSVNLFHDKGFEMFTDTAHIDLDAGRAEGNQPVTGQGPAGELSSEGFLILDRGATIVFTGKARLLLYPGARETLQ